MHGRLDIGGKTEIEIPEGYNSSVYTLKGILLTDGFEVPAQQLIWYKENGSKIQLTALEDSEFVVLAGLPIEEPIANYGPFVMNTKAELIEAIEEYQSGKMGTLAE